MKEIKGIVANTIAIAFIGLLFLFVLTWIIFDFQDSSTSLKDTWTIVSSLFGGITTLIAAYIAALLYSDWKDPHNSTIETQHKKEILSVIRALAPMEEKYYRIISNHFIYHDQPNRNIPINLVKSDTDTFFSHVNNLLSLLEELYFISKDESIKNIREHYFNYAQLYSGILYGAEHFYKDSTEMTLREFLQTSLEFDYVNKDGKKISSYTLYAYALKGIRNTELKKHISESLKI